MSLVKNNRYGMTGLFDDFFSGDPGWRNFPAMRDTMPATNIRESNDHYHVEVAAPGMNKEDFKVEVDGNHLIISSEKSSSEQEGRNDEKYSRREFSYQSFERSFTFRKELVDADKIEARYENGILKLDIPKRKDAADQQVRRVKIS